MHRRRTWLWGCWLLLWLAPHAMAAQIQVYSEELRPLAFIRDGRQEGLAVELVAEIMRRVDNTGSITLVPWARGWHYVTTRPDVALFTMSWTTERARKFTLLGPLLLGEINLYTRSDNNQQSGDVDQISPLQRIPVTRSGICNDSLREVGLGPQLHDVTMTVQAIKMVSKRRADFFCAYDYTANVLIRQAGYSPSAFKKFATLRQDRTYIAFSSETDRVQLAAWLAALREMRAEGVIERISSKWLPGIRLPDKIEMIGGR